MRTLLGTIEVEQPYYYCAHCRQGVPSEGRLEHFSPAVQQLAALAGIQQSYQQGAQLLWQMSGVNLSESSLERLTEKAGERLAQRQQQGETFTGETAWDWQRDGQGRRCGYASIDLTGVRQQGPGGAKAAGRMVAVGRVYNAPDAEGSPRESMCVAGLSDLSALTTHLAAMATAVGGDQVEQWVVLCDGGSGLENALKTAFPHCQVILDFWHAQNYLVELSQAWPFATDAHRQTWLNTLRHQLKHHGGSSVLLELRQLPLPPQASATLKTAYESTLRYFENQASRMNYPYYVSQGWQIGSGPVESCCKQVVNSRLCGSGMRWSSPSTDQVSRLRSLWISGPSCWQSFWSLSL